MRISTGNKWAMATLLLGALPGAWAQDIEPRAYSNAPIGMNFLVAGYAYTEGGLAFDPSLPVNNPQLETDNGVLGLARVIELGGQSAKLDVILPFTDLAGSADYRGSKVERAVDGLGDVKFRLNANLYGAPALDMGQFRGYRQDLILGASLQVSAPTGQYDHTKLINIGSNRWSIKPELGVSQAFGPWTLELASSATFYTDNTDFFNGHTRAQDPIYAVQGHAIYSIGNGIWGSLDLNYFAGGRSSLDGVRNDDLQENWRVGGTLALPVDKHNSVKLYASSGVSARTGNNFDLLGIAWQHRWGGGL